MECLSFECLILIRWFVFNYCVQDCELTWFRTKSIGFHAFKWYYLRFKCICIANIIAICLCRCVICCCCCFSFSLIFFYVKSIPLISLCATNIFIILSVSFAPIRQRAYDFLFHHLQCFTTSACFQIFIQFRPISSFNVFLFATAKKRGPEKKAKYHFAMSTMPLPCTYFRCEYFLSDV